MQSAWFKFCMKLLVVKIAGPAWFLLRLASLPGWWRLLIRRRQHCLLFLRARLMVKIAGHVRRQRRVLRVVGWWRRRQQRRRFLRAHLLSPGKNFYDTLGSPNVASSVDSSGDVSSLIVIDLPFGNVSLSSYGISPNTYYTIDSGYALTNGTISMGGYNNARFSYGFIRINLSIITEK